MTEIHKNSNQILSKILDIRKTYTEYVNKANKTDHKYDKIRTSAPRPKQDLYISNKKKTSHHSSPRTSLKTGTI